MESEWLEDVINDLQYEMDITAKLLTNKKDVR